MAARRMSHHRRQLFTALAALLLAWLMAGPTPTPAPAADPPREMIEPTVMAPVPDGVSLAVPSILGNRKLAEMGYLDVTAPPFLADPTGRMDSTGAIQRAVNYARDKQMVCFFPEGTYLISDTIECVQQLYRRSSGKVLGARNHPCVLIGSRAGSRPTIRLAPTSPGFNDPVSPKYVIHFLARGPDDDKPHPNVSMHQVLENIDVTIGPGNAGAVGIRHRAAQGSAIMDCTVDATHGLTGIEGGIGSGGSMAGVTVIGGRIGLDLRETQPAPTITGVTLLDQRGPAILYSGRQALSAVGVRIRTTYAGPAIETRSVSWSPHHGQLCLDDASIVFAGPPGTAVSAQSSLYMRDVYVFNAATAVRPAHGPARKGRPGGWWSAAEYAQRQDPAPWKGYRYSAPILVDGQDAGREYFKPGPTGPPPYDVVARHLWGDPPHFQTPGAVNVKEPPYLAAGDAVTDDTDALQKALDEHDVIFLPKGYYLLTRPLRMRPGNRLVGVAGHLSTLMARPESWMGGKSPGPRPLVRTADAGQRPNQLDSLGLYTPRLADTAYALHWSCGGRSTLRNVTFSDHPPLGGYARARPAKARTAPTVLAEKGGGRWYNFSMESHLDQAPSYRHLLVRDLAGPLSIYQCDPEHARGDANMEIVRSSHVHIHGLKGEGNLPVLRITDSSDVQVLGYGGNAAAFEGKALFEVDGCRNCVLANLVDSPRLAGAGSEESFAGRGVDPDLWHMIHDTALGDTAPLARPAAYLTSAPEGLP